MTYYTMKQLLLALLSCIILTGPTWAEPVSLEQALAKARQHTARKATQAELRLANNAPASVRGFSGRSNDQLLYVFNIGSDQGFVIVSGDDQTEAVLGYADQGTFDYDHLPENVSTWLDHYAEQIGRIRQGGMASTFRAPAHDQVDQLMTSKWDQGYPYNSQCPKFVNGARSVTGCVATAMAQILYYHREKAVKTIQNEIKAYDCSTEWTDYGKVHVDAIPAGTPIDWDNMVDDCKSWATEEQKDAVANLMKYCGAGLRADYRDQANGGTLAYVLMVPIAAKAYFGFSDKATIKYHNAMTDEAWEQMIYDELAAARPVLMGGQTSGGVGHAFVCDGYDGSGMYHINWGWGGYCDGYFLLTNLDAGGAGIGGGSGPYQYQQDAIINMEPGDGTPYVEQIRLTTTDVSFYNADTKETYKESYTESKGYFGATLYYSHNAYNYTTETHDFQSALGLYKDDELISVHQIRNIKDFTNNVSYTFQGYFSIGGGQEEGTYRIYPISREKDADTWLKNEGADQNYYVMEVTDAQITFSIGTPEDPGPGPEPDPITVTVRDCSREYGEENPTFEYEVTGGTLTGDPVITCEATETTAVGTYNITIGMGTISNTKVTLNGGTLTITPAPLTVTARSYTRKQGEENPMFEIDYEGFKLGETEEVLKEIPTANCEATPESEPGVYVINVDGGEADNYTFIYVPGELTVEPVEPVVLTANSFTREYGDENPMFDFVCEGGELTGMPEITCEATKESPVGSYPIKITIGTVENKAVTLVDGELTITPAPLTVTARSYTRKQGDENPMFEIDYEGFKLGETEEALTEIPTANCEATPESEPGDYAITLTEGEAQNYVLMLVNGTLTVEEADPVVLMALSYEREYGDDNPDFGFTSEGAPVDGEPQIICEATKESPVGSYPIRIFKGTVKNYNDSYMDGTLTITKAMLYVSVTDTIKEEGQDSPDFTISIEGFKLGETAEVLTAMPQATCEATADSPVGEYVIVVSGGEAQNYELTYTNGKLTVIESTAIARLVGSNIPFDVYDLKGLLIARQVTTLKGLPHGIYIVKVKNRSTIIKK